MGTAAAKTKKTGTPEELAARHLRELELGKLHYGRGDRALAELLAQVEPGAVIDLGNGRKAKVVDKYAGKTQVFHGSFCRRYELEVEKL